MGLNGRTYNKAKVKTKIRILKGLGYALTVYAFYENGEMLKNGEISESRYKYNNMNIVVSTVFPQYAIAIIVGDYFGQKYADDIEYVITEGVIGQILLYIEHDLIGVDEFGVPIKE